MGWNMFSSDAVEDKYRDHRAEIVRRKMAAVEAEISALHAQHVELTRELEKWQ